MFSKGQSDAGTIEPRPWVSLRDSLKKPIILIATIGALVCVFDAGMVLSTRRTYDAVTAFSLATDAGFIAVSITIQALFASDARSRPTKFSLGAMLAASAAWVLASFG
jgi:hypothetical protein